MRKKILLFGTLGVFTVASLLFTNQDAEAQTTISCPDGDEYTCYTGEGPTGGPVEVKKGSGQVIITIPKKKSIQD